MSASRRSSSARSVSLAAFALVLACGGALAACGEDEATPEGIEEGAAGVPNPDSPELVDPVTAEAFLAGAPAGLVVLDVRTPAEFAEGHLAGAQLIDFQSPSFAADVAEIDRDLPIFVYCRSGNRSAQAVATMVELGFTDLTELDGGVVAWQAAGLPLVTG